MINLTEKQINIAKKFIPDIEELVKDEKNADYIVNELFSNIEFDDDCEKPTDFGCEVEDLTDYVNSVYNTNYAFSDKSKCRLYKCIENPPKGNFIVNKEYLAEGVINAFAIIDENNEIYPFYDDVFNKCFIKI